jgi:hypothetical protein
MKAEIIERMGNYNWCAQCAPYFKGKSDIYKRTRRRWWYLGRRWRDWGAMVDIALWVAVVATAAFFWWVVS